MESGKPIAEDKECDDVKIIKRIQLRRFLGGDLNGHLDYSMIAVQVIRRTVFRASSTSLIESTDGEGIGRFAGLSGIRSKNYE